jgi:hypothetical protein
MNEYRLLLLQNRAKQATRAFIMAMCFAIAFAGSFVYAKRFAKG